MRRGRGLRPQVHFLEQLPGLRIALGLGGAAAMGRQQNQRPQVARVLDAARRDAAAVVRVAQRGPAPGRGGCRLPQSPQQWGAVPVVGGHGGVEGS